MEGAKSKRMRARALILLLAACSGIVPADPSPASKGEVAAGTWRQVVSAKPRQLVLLLGEGRRLPLLFLRGGRAAEGGSSNSGTEAVGSASGGRR